MLKRFIDGILFSNVNILKILFISLPNIFKRKKYKPKLNQGLGFESSLKYYLYISQTKIDILHPQIPPNFLKKASADLKINLGIISSTIKASNIDTLLELPQKLAIVCQYLISTGEVGNTESPKSYIGGTLPLRYGAIKLGSMDADLAFLATLFITRKLV